MMKKKIYYTSPIFKNITHGFFSKNGGISTGIYDSLNCGKSSLDYEKNVIKNRKIVSDILGFDNKSLVIGNQFHSNKVVVINKYENDIKCDAIISLSKNIVVGVLTADCCPILVAHKEKLLVASIHLGWKGLFNGILNNFLYETKKLKITNSDLLFSLGPCIGKNSYEVDSKFKEKFVNKDQKSSHFFSHINKNIYLFDLRGYARFLLNKLGFSNIWCSNHDTYVQKKDFFSYRRSMHNNLNDYGRMISVIKK